MLYNSQHSCACSRGWHFRMGVLLCELILREYWANFICQWHFAYCACLSMFNLLYVMWYLFHESIVYVRPQWRKAIFTAWLWPRVFCPVWTHLLDKLQQQMLINSCSILWSVCRLVPVAAGFRMIVLANRRDTSFYLISKAAAFMSWIGRAIHFLEMTFIGFVAMCLAVAQAVFGLHNFFVSRSDVYRYKSCKSPRWAQDGMVWSEWMINQQRCIVANSGSLNYPFGGASNNANLW